MDVDKALKERRAVASQASAGASSGPVYDSFVNLLVQLDLNGRLLDFGAGVGHLINDLLRLRRFQITGADLMRRPVGLDESVTWVEADLNERLNIADESFDVIVAAEVIEHLENPRAVAREWFRLLRPGGTLLISTPNNESWRALLALIVRGHFVLFGDSSYPAHITALVRKDIERVLCETGFSPATFTFTNIGGIPKMPAFQWQRISKAFKGLRYSDNVIAVARKP